MHYLLVTLTSLFLLFCYPVRSEAGANDGADVSVYDIVNLFENKKVPQKTELGVSSSPVSCAICTVVVKDLEYLMSFNATREEFNYMAIKVCRKMGRDQEKCNQIIDNYIKNIYNMFANGLPPRQICEVMSLCPFHLYDFRQLGCNLCTFAIDKVRQEILTDYSPEKVKILSENVCHNITSPSWKKLCTDLIGSNGQIIVEHITNDIKSIEVCRTISFCPKPHLLKSVSTQSLATKPEASLTFDKYGNFDIGECELCEFLMEFGKLASDFQSAINVKLLMKRMCYSMGRLNSAQCHQIVFTDYARFISLAKSKAPRQACQELGGYCKQSARLNPLFLSSQFVSHEVCSVCKMAVSKTEWLLRHNFPLAFIERSSALFCKMNEAVSKRDFCQSNFASHMKWIMEELRRNSNVTDVCQKMDMCRPDASSSPSITGQQRCDLCTSAAYACAANANRTNLIPHDSEKFVPFTSEFCFYYTQNTSLSVSECFDQVSAEMPLIDALGILNVMPTDICQALDFCKDTHQRRTVGEHMVTKEDKIFHWCRTSSIHYRPLCRVILRYYIAKHTAILNIIPQNGVRFNLVMPIAKPRTLKIEDPVFAPPVINDHADGSKFCGFIPLEELNISYMTSSGPGGQHVNKTRSKVEIRFNVQKASFVPDHLRELIAKKEAGRINKDGELIVSSDKTRQQILNKADCLERIRQIIRAAEAKPRETEASTLAKHAECKTRANEQRLQRKKLSSDTKFHRSKPSMHDAEQKKLDLATMRLPSIAPECNQAKQEYDECFLDFFPRYLNGSITPEQLAKEGGDPCKDKLRKYQQCLEPKLKKLDLNLTELYRKRLDFADE
ncbi:Peptidyl-tRNA hydrolase ict1, mitochondrial [Cichlidogyrus casuarinus]|uniref:Large ribosomal subunit protein mL62 n=1 Tax=Cichlidogyrus casuarinus TaxID=1844966 RepID=A0ABD2Q3C5_9PLAT